MGASPEDRPAPLGELLPKPGVVVAVMTVLALALVAVGATTLVTNIVGSPSRPRPAAVRTAALPTVLPPTTPSLPPPQVPVSTVLAAPDGTVADYGTPGGAQIGTVGTWYGYPLVLPVIARQPGWLDVRLPQRPNESTAWVRRADVKLTWTPYRIVVNLTTERLTVYRGGYPMMRFPVGTGLPATPTVTGHYFVAVHETHPEALYGPVVLDLSAHSDAIQSWEGMGDAIIAIHGPIDAAADAAIGTTGARVSNGCIRMHDADLQRLSIIPTGTPVDINP